LSQILPYRSAKGEQAGLSFRLPVTLTMTPPAFAKSSTN
jgi:hypothetical protein